MPVLSKRQLFRYYIIFSPARAVPACLAVLFEKRKLAFSQERWLSFRGGLEPSRDSGGKTSNPASNQSSSFKNQDLIFGGDSKPQQLEDPRRLALCIHNLLRELVLGRLVPLFLAAGSPVKINAPAQMHKQTKTSSARHIHPLAQTLWALNLGTCACTNSLDPKP